VKAVDADLALPLDGHPAQPGAPMVRLELSAGAAATMIRNIGLTLMPMLACASVDGADQGHSSLDGDASSGSGATPTGGRAPEAGGGSMVSGGAAGASGSTTAPPDLPCDCTRPCPLNCELREELNPGYGYIFDWPCGKARDDDFLLECYRPYAADALVLIGRCEYIGVRYTSHRMYTDWYDAVTHELVGWEVWDPTMPLSPFMCYGAIPPPPWECDGPVCTVSCSRPDASCDLSDLTVDADPM
jgi:hypothetical protein